MSLHTPYFWHYIALCEVSVSCEVPCVYVSFLRQQQHYIDDTEKKTRANQVDTCNFFIIMRTEKKKSKI